MFASRKPMAIALAVVMVFAMLVPAAMAAPQVLTPGVQAVTITWPGSDDGTNPSKAALVNPDKWADPAKADVQGDDKFKAKFKLTIDGAMPDTIRVHYYVVDGNQADPIESYEEFDTNGTPKLVNGVELTSRWLHTHQHPEYKGWYTLQICVQSDDTQSPDEWVCTQVPNAVFIDPEAPGVEMMKPLDDSVVTGGANNKYILSGQAWDPADAEDSMIERYGRIVKTWFDYCPNPDPNETEDCHTYATEGWQPIGDGVRNAVGDTWQLPWDTTWAPDGHAWVRFCAIDLVGLVTCQRAEVVIANRFTIELEAGWNLISTPVMLYDKNMANLFKPLTDASKVLAVYGMVNTGDPANEYVWSMWTPGDATVPNFDHGKGYWVDMAADGDLQFIGAFMGVGPVSPPQYQVYKDWNLIGYTHWGTPSSPHTFPFEDKTVADYLGVFSNSPKLQALWRFDAAANQYVPMNWASTMVKGAGYWLGMSDNGTITP